ncbi:peptidase inhibitor family I36 protein [Kribbella sp. CA-247076]|uniref:peptidase inhibitor family I36 protein n=1 Tax=Kribbella sp. CA-247076 TaxID=3239941 RepID=UPI003D8E5ACE
MKLTTRIVALGALVAGAFSLTTVPASAEIQPQGDSGVTHAAGGYERCPAGYLCIFEWRDGTGPMAYFKSGSPDLRQQGMNDSVSSIWNRTDCFWSLYEGLNYTGWRIHYLPNDQFSWPGWQDGYEDNMSSLRLELC